MPHRSLWICAAQGTDTSLCDEDPYREGRWCSRHREQHDLLLEKLKNYRAAMENLFLDDVERDVSRIRLLDFPSAVSFRDSLELKRSNLMGCLDAHECFWERFHGDDMDFGRRTYGPSLKRKYNEVETLLSATEDRIHELELARLHASWILDAQRPSGTVSQFLEACCEYPELFVAEASIPPSPAMKFEFDVVPNPVEETMKRKRYGMIIGIWDYIASLCTPPESHLYEERLAVVYTHVARCLISDSSLFLAAQKYPTVKAFLHDLNHDLSILGKLMDVFSQHNVHSVRAAIDDVLRPRDDDGEHVVFLGIRLFKDLSDAPLPFRAWGHWAVFFPSPCLCAVRKGFSTASHISLSLKFMQLHGVKAPSGYPKHLNTHLETLKLCGIHMGPLKPVELRHRIEKRNTPDGQPLWVEIHNAISITSTIPVNEPISSQFLSICMRHPDLTLRIRGPGGDVANFPEELWAARTRQAATCEELETTPWVFMPVADNNLEEAQHALTSGMPLKDTLDFMILDTSDCDFEQVLEKLATICLELHGVADLKSLYTHYTLSFAQEGELETDERGELMSVNCLPEDLWLMRMHLLEAEVPSRIEEHRHFSQRFSYRLNIC